MSVDQPIPREDEKMSDIDDCLKSVERLTRDRGEVMRACNDKIAENLARHEAACGGDELLRAAFTRLLDRLTRERDEARAEVARLLLGSEVLVSHQGSLEREWHSAGAWLYPGDSINVVRAPMPEIEVVS